MHAFALIIFGGTAFIWIILGLRIAYGALNLPWIKDFPPITGTGVPRISLLFAARDEEEKLPGALATLATIDYPNLEIIAVDDRSADATARILDEFALTGLKTGHYNGSDDRGDAEVRVAGLKPGGDTGGEQARFRVVHVT